MFELVYVLLQAVAWIAIVIAAWATCCFLISLVEAAALRRRRKRRAEIEALLDQKQAELRGAVLRLAEALAQERLAAADASKQMVARAYLTTGRLP